MMPANGYKILPSEGESEARREDSLPGVTITLRKLSLHLHSYKLHTQSPRINRLLSIGGGKNEQVLHSISATMPAGHLIAVMGPSGCGKTSLLNAMSGRIRASENVTVSGDILFNGQVVTLKMLENLTGYVLQGDFLHPHLTVYETLACSAMLRLPANLTKEQKMAQVESVIAELGLRHCRNTRIGNDEKRGISGGEKRRVSIAMQLLTNPSVLFLDEPTSGLDSFMALNVMEALVRLARRGRTVICTIHQPRSDIFQLFDSVMLLSKGRTVYYGNTRDITGYLQSLGYHCPAKCNPADFILDVASVDNRNPKAEAEGKARIKKLTDHYSTLEELAAAQAPPVIPSRAAPFQPQKKVGFFLECYILFLRSTRNLYRDKKVMLVGVLEAVLVAAMIGAAFFRLGDSLSDIRSRAALFFTIVQLQSFIILSYSTYQLTKELPVFDRERQDNQYRVISFVVARTLASLPVDILFPFLFATVVYWLSGLWPDIYHYVMFGIITGLHLYSAVSWSWLCASITRNFAWASLCANSISLFCALTCGFLINPNSFPNYVAWFRHVDPLRYAWDLMMVNEFGRGRTFPCPEGNPDECYLYNGEQILKNAGVETFDINFLFSVQIAIIAFFRFASLFVLYAFPRIASMSAPLPPPINAHTSAPYGTFTGNLAETSSSLCITLDDVEVRLGEVGIEELKRIVREGKRRWRLISMGARGKYTIKQKERDMHEEAGIALEKGPSERGKVVLRKVTGSLKTGELVVLMGGSGSGKTTLLNAIAGRGENMQIRGEVLINGMDMLEDLKYLTGYVLQNDYLHPCLTVRECLTYIAMLRLPSTLSTEEKTTRVDEIILELGLKDCANTLIGDEFVRGISGGEKRRVSIAAQMLTDPSILLLDEPTSGLDAFTAHNIVDTLRRIARQGRIVVCSIHQPRTDIFHMFDSIILLTKGNVAYFGPSGDILSHFAKLGFECPNDTNPADFLLDVTSIDSRDSQQEAESSARVHSIVAQWTSLPLLPSSKSGDRYKSGGPRSYEKSPYVNSKPKPENPSGSASSSLLASASGSFRKLLASRENLEENTTNEFVNSVSYIRPLMKKPNSVFVAVPILIKRSFRNMTRQPLFMLSRVMQAIAYALILAIYYTPLGYDQMGVQNRIGLLYMVISSGMVGMLNSTAFFPPERNVFYRENADGSYSSLSFYLMYTITEIPYDIFMAISFSSVMYFLVGIDFVWDRFSMFSFIVFLCIFSGESIGAVLNLFIYDVGLANALTSSVLSFFGIMSGFVTSSLLYVLAGINTISILKYAAHVMSVDHFEGLAFTCDADYCPYRTGDDVLASYGFSKSGYWPAFGALIGCAVGYRFLGWIVISFTKKKYAQ
eukprot:Phypoly_transcript_00723.p1 GENE.Phypoly_transcript_00723~~Phypoly_transcript_00723.p1  ORF type:complete len:1358 (+),score=194.06 Phypoly_transcript_00723:83-4156(+)